MSSTNGRYPVREPGREHTELGSELSQTIGLPPEDLGLVHESLDMKMDQLLQFTGSTLTQTANTYTWLYSTPELAGFSYRTLLGKPFDAIKHVARFSIGMAGKHLIDANLILRQKNNLDVANIDITANPDRTKSGKVRTARTVDSLPSTPLKRATEDDLIALLFDLAQQTRNPAIKDSTLLTVEGALETLTEISPSSTTMWEGWYETANEPYNGSVHITKTNFNELIEGQRTTFEIDTLKVFPRSVGEDAVATVGLSLATHLDAPEITATLRAAFTLAKDEVMDDQDRRNALLDSLVADYHNPIAVYDAIGANLDAAYSTQRLL